MRVRRGLRPTAFVCLCLCAASFTYFGEVLRCPHKRIVTITKVYIARNTIHVLVTLHSVYDCLQVDSRQRVNKRLVIINFIYTLYNPSREEILFNFKCVYKVVLIVVKNGRSYKHRTLRTMLRDQ